MKYLLLSICLITSACTVVGPGERGIRVSLGHVSSEELEPGPHFWLPFIFGTTTLNIQIQKSDIHTSAATKDMQDITAELAVNWSLNPKNIVSTYRDIGSEADVYQRIIIPSVNEIMKASSANKTAEEVLTKRLELKKDIDIGLGKRLEKYGIVFLDVSLVNLSFSKEFTAAIEQKQIAEQKAKEAEYRTLEAIQTAKADVNIARGQAESQRLMRETITKDLLQQKAIDKWNGILPVYMGAGAVPFLNLTQSKHSAD